LKKLLTLAIAAADAECYMTILDTTVTYIGWDFTPFTQKDY
jgi:hypothetical protein